MVHGGVQRRRSRRSSTARKRKPTDELLNQASSPVKAKRRLFDSPAPISSATASQEPVNSEAWCELAARLKSLHNGIKSKPSQDEAEPETSPDQVRSYELFHQLESLRSGLVPKSSQEEEAKPEEPEAHQLESLHSRLVPKPEASQEKLSSRASYTLQQQGKSYGTWNSAFRSELEQDQVLDSVSGSELEPSQDKVSESIIQRFWTKAIEEPEGSQEKLLRDKSNATLDSASMSKLGQSQDKVSESIIQRFWTSETEASQVDRATMNCSLMASGALPMPAHCTPEAALSGASWIGNDITSSYSSELGWFVSPTPPMPAHYALGGLSSASWIGNDITASCSSEHGRVVGAPTYNELGGITGGGFTSEPDVPPMPAPCALGALSSASWIGNDITTSCSSELGRVVGAPTYNKLGGIAGGGFTSEPDMRSIPFPPVPPAAVASWFFSGPDIWSC